MRCHCNWPMTYGKDRPPCARKWNTSKACIRLRHLFTKSAVTPSTDLLLPSGSTFSPETWNWNPFCASLILAFSTIAILFLSIWLSKCSFRLLPLVPRIAARLLEIRQSRHGCLEWCSLYCLRMFLQLHGTNECLKICFRTSFIHLHGLYWCRCWQCLCSASLLSTSYIWWWPLTWLTLARLMLFNRFICKKKKRMTLKRAASPRDPVCAINRPSPMHLDQNLKRFQAIEKEKTIPVSVSDATTAIATVFQQSGECTCSFMREGHGF